MQFIHNDITGRTIDIGNLVVYVEQGGYGGIPDLKFGEVLAFTKTTIKFQPTDQHGVPLERDVGHWRGLGTFTTTNWGSTREDKEWVLTGKERVSAEAIKHTADARFYVVRP